MRVIVHLTVLVATTAGVNITAAAMCETERNQYDENVRRGTALRPQSFQSFEELDEKIKANNLDYVKSVHDYYARGYLTDPDGYRMLGGDSYEQIRKCTVSKLEEIFPSLKPKTAAKSDGRSQPAKSKVDEDKKSIAYYASDKRCLKHGVDASGRETYTNVCKMPVVFGYCHVYPRDETDGTGCKATPSEFSRSGYGYVTQGGGLEPGATHTKAYAYERTQSTFLVACRAGRNPLIESFDAKSITATAKARSSCWAFTDNNKSVKP